MSSDPHLPPDASDDIAEAVVATAKEAVRPVVRRGLSVVGILAAAAIGTPLFLGLTLAWTFTGGLLIDLVLPPGGGQVASTIALLLWVVPPLVVTFLVLRWGLVHLPPNVRGYFTS